MKPFGLRHPVTGREPYAVVQLRQDDLAKDHYNVVGFQTKLKVGEQKRVFRTIPGFENAEFVRFGMLHRNTYLNGPAHLDRLFRWKRDPRVFFGGQITGVEGYLESAATGLMIGVTLARLSKHRVTRIAWALYPLLVTFVIVATGNHFLSDAILGAVTAGLSAWAASWLARARPTAWAFRTAKA